MSDSFELVPGELQRLRYIARTSYNTVLHYDLRTDDMSVWHWPVAETGETVPPSDLRDHRLSNRFKGPCCLCAKLAHDKGEDAHYVESAMFMITTGARAGEYVAKCATDQCGYEVHLERLYSRRGLKIGRYPRRESCEQPPPTIFHASEHRQIKVARPVKRAYQMIELDENSMPPTRMAPARRKQDAISDLFMLDAPIRPGLPLAKFRAMFRICPCGLVVTRRAFSRHFCVRQEGQLERSAGHVNGEVIDLTRDDVDADDYADAGANHIQTKDGSSEADGAGDESGDSTETDWEFE